MTNSLSNYFNGMVENTKDVFCDMLNDPSLWSREIIKETLKHSGSKPFNIEDVQHIVRDYLTVLSENIRQDRI